MPSGVPLPSGIVMPSLSTPPLPTSRYATPTIYCLGACPTIPPTPTPIDEPDNPDTGEEVQEPPTEEEPPSDETGESPGEEDTTPEEQPEVSNNDALQQLLSFIMRLIQAILKLFLYPL
jgi:hypothetical protein